MKYLTPEWIAEQRQISEIVDMACEYVPGSVVPLLKQIEKSQTAALDALEAAYADTAISAIKTEPAADVVEVVRCKDCEQYVAGELGYGKCNFFKTAIFSEFYCRYGGKKGRPE